MGLALIISILVLIAGVILSNSFVSLIFSIFILLFGSLFAKTIIPRENLKKSLKLFYIVLSTYGFFAIIHYLGYYEDYENFAQYWRDEYKFFLLSESYEHTPIYNIIIDCFIYNKHIENEGYIFYIASLSSIAGNYFDGNNLYLQFLGTVFISSLCSILIYRFLLFYIDGRRAYSYALKYLIFTAFFSVTFILLRDVFICFLYLLGFIIISESFSIGRLIKLIIITIVIWQFRFEHGFFFILYIIYFLYLRFRKQKLIFIGILSVFSILSITLVADKLNKASQTMEHYSEFTSSSAAGKDDSFGKVLYKLPTPVKEVTILINSQIQPFPSWTALGKSKNIYETIEQVLPIVYAYYWFIVFFTIIYIGIIKNRIKQMSSKITLLLLISLLFLLINTSNMTLRRIICVYPIFFLCFIMIKTYYVKHKFYIKNLQIGTFLYLSLVSLYIILKGL